MFNAIIGRNNLTRLFIGLRNFFLSPSFHVNILALRTICSTLLSTVGFEYRSSEVKTPGAENRVLVFIVSSIFGNGGCG